MKYIHFLHVSMWCKNRTNWMIMCNLAIMILIYVVGILS